MSVTCGLDFERHLPASSYDVRGSILQAVRELGFQVTVEQLTRIEAKRGGMLGYSLLIKKQMPVLAVFEVTAEGSGCVVVAHFTDNIKMLGKTWGINSQFREIFQELAGRVDIGLAALAGVAPQSFPEPRFWSKAANIPVLEQSTVVTSRAMGGAVGAATKVIDGQTDATPKVWKGVDSVTFTSSAGVAVLTLAQTQADLGVAVLVVSHPGSMPEKLASDVEAFAASLEQRLTAAGGQATLVEVADAQRPVLEFIHQQAQIRAELPLRELHICRSCRLEKITNPEYERIHKRNEKIGDIVAGVGATIGKGGISPTFVLGQVFKMKRLDPEYVCSRCQGMEADERIVTYCPKCAELQRDVVLRLCPKCGFDFRTTAARTSMWVTPVEPAVEPPVASPVAALETPAPALVAVPAPAAVPAPVAALAAPIPAPAAPAPAPMPPSAPTAGPAAAPTAWPHPMQVPIGRPLAGVQGKVCQTCGREFPALWRIVIATPAGFEERFVCGTSPACQVPSVIPAVQV